MTPLFGPRSTTIFRIVLVGTPIALLSLLAVSVVWKTSPYSAEQLVVQSQPVPFSHNHHAGGLGIDCRYCHAGVEQNAFAGMPSTHTCMTCHSQIWTTAPVLEQIRESQRTGKLVAWNRVYRLPKHVYFHHGVHIQAGVACKTCHGPVEQMPLLWKARSFTMRDCLSCHEPEEKKINAKAGLSGPQPTGRLTSCNTCHR